MLRGWLVCSNHRSQLRTQSHRSPRSRTKSELVRLGWISEVIGDALFVRVGSDRFDEPNLYTAEKMHQRRLSRTRMEQKGKGSARLPDAFSAGVRLVFDPANLTNEIAHPGKPVRLVDGLRVDAMSRW